MVIFSHPIFTELLLPFLLVFVVLFAILQKSKILGEGKPQIDSLVSLSIALILLAFPAPRKIIVEMMPWLSVAVIVMLVFFILWGFAGGKLEGPKTQWIRIVFGILAGIFVIGLVGYVTGFWTILESWLSSDYSEIWINILFLAIVGGAIALVLSTSPKSGQPRGPG
ncbi:MAG: hypothetical protein ACOYT4_03980 [Nanoarchaeota archaeon]